MLQNSILFSDKKSFLNELSRSIPTHFIPSIPAQYWVLLITLLSVSVTSSFIGTWIQYQTALKDTADQLHVAANSQAKIIKLLSDDTDDTEHLIIKINDLADYHGLGDTGEFVIGRKYGESVQILTKMRHHTETIKNLNTGKLGEHHILSVPLGSGFAAPMKLALSGHMGDIIALDYRGEEVMAAYHPVEGTSLGVVAKIDMREITAPYIHNFFIAFLGALVVAGIGGYIIYRVNRDIFESLAASKKEAYIGFEGIINALSKALDIRDPYTGGHQRRVSIISEKLARKLKLSENEVIGIRIGALVHDIGKIKVPAEILNRPGRLDDEEMSVVKRHPVTGHEIIGDIHLPWPVDEIISQHHERIDGSGYPFGLKGDEISLEAKIVSACDALEAITSHRPYRPQKPLSEAVAFLKNQRGVSFEAYIVDALLKMIDNGELEFLNPGQAPSQA